MVRRIVKQAIPELFGNSGTEFCASDGHERERVRKTFTKCEVRSLSLFDGQIEEDVGGRTNLGWVDAS